MKGELQVVQEREQGEQGWGGVALQRLQLLASPREGREVSD